MDYLIANWTTMRSASQMQAYLEEMGSGRLPHMVPIFTELLGRLEPSKPKEKAKNTSPGLRSERDIRAWIAGVSPDE